MPSLRAELRQLRAQRSSLSDEMGQYQRRLRDAQDYYNQCIADGRSSKTVKKASQQVKKWERNVDDIGYYLDRVERRIKDHISAIEAEQTTIEALESFDSYNYLPNDVTSQINYYASRRDPRDY